jgi:manganese-dependent inorganic pyrophosphatase
MPAQGYVFSYVNPDTDGVASAIGYTFLRRARDDVRFQPLIWGDLNAETTLVLAHFHASAPAQGRDLPPDADLVLVDTHHPAQLASQVNPQRVVEIIDHHPGGSPEAFPNAIIQNETVGAAATLLVERIVRHNLQPGPIISGLLAAAIVSNTYNLVAPSTTIRDREALDWLSQHCDFDDSLPGRMMQAASATAGRDTSDLMIHNYKNFQLGSLSIGIVQIETTLPVDILTRADLQSALADLRSKEQVDHVLLSVIDLAGAQTHLITDSQDSKQLMEQALEVSFTGGIATVPRILMRKTDLVPGLGAFLVNRQQGGT